MPSMPRMLTRIYLPVTLCLLGTAATAQVSLSPQKMQPSAYDAAALELLQKMVNRYAHLSALQQISEYTSSITPLGKTPAPQVQNSAGSATAPSVPEALAPSAQGDPGPGQKIDRKVTLAYAQPNYLKLEDFSARATDRSQGQYWVSDGKSFWAYVPNAHGQGQLLYTQEKAPRRIEDFAKLQNFDPGSLELLMLMGINPFHNLKAEVDSVRDEGETLVRGTPAEVIGMTATTPAERTDVHLYIDKSDYLLLRLTSDVTPIGAQSGQSARIDDALTEMEEERNPPPPPTTDRPQVGEANPTNFLGGPNTDRPQIPQQMHMGYDNIITRAPLFSQETFAFTPPNGASRFLPVGSKVVVDPHAHHLIDLIKRSRNGKLKSIHPTKPVHDVTP